MTILAVSQEVTPDTKQEDIKYKGPFYADIDIKSDIPAAARSTLELVERLQDREVPEDLIQIYASGSKGFHIIVDERCFSTGRPVKGLPYVYKEMALAFYVTGMDMQVYCGGRGNSWRLENLEREDGNYRVRITQEELEGIIKDAALYKKLVSNPRVMPAPPEPLGKSASLEALFLRCKAQAAKAPVEKATVTSERLEREFKEDLPECVTAMRDGQLKNSANYNQVALNMAVFSARSGRSESEFKSLATRMSENTESSMYNSPQKRLVHAEGVYKYIKTSEKYQFSCGAMRSLVSQNPCEGCNLNRTGEDAESTMQAVGITSSEGVYYKVSGNGAASLISTFVVTPKHKVTGPSEDDPRVEVLKGVMCEVLVNNGTACERIFGESSWKSKSNFLTTIEGIEGATFFGSDSDIQKLKFFVFSEDNAMDEVKEVLQAGLRIEEYKGYPLPVYVEPGLSLNKFGTQGTHVLVKDIPTAPSMRSILLGEVQIQEAGECLENLFQINKPEVIGLLLGWFCASHLKAHLMHAYKQFPLVNLWGNAGSGKTRTAEMMMWLTGCASDYASLSLSLPHTTKFALLDYVTSTMTIPRILEEFNKARMGDRDYNNAHEIMKSAYNSHPVTRGVLGGGRSQSGVNARTVKMEVTSPILYVSEQPVESPPLRQRTLSIGMDSRGRSQGSYAWNQLQKSHKRLEVVAKLLCLEAIATSVDELRTMMDKVVLDLPDMEDRPRYNLQVCLMGLEFLRMVLIKNAVDQSVIEGLDLLRAELDEEFLKVVSETMQQTARTEVDLVLEDMAMMAYLQATDSIEGLKKGVHYHINDSSLYLDLPVAHSLYLRYKRSNNVVIETYSQMVKLLRTESYFTAEAVVDETLDMNRKYIQLDLNKMKSKGIEVSLFN